MPEVLEYLWRYFTELERGRRYGQHGPEPITWQDIDAWARLMDRTLEPYEVEALLMLDALVRFPGDDKD